jgi:hypothetical protein
MKISDEAVKPLAKIINGDNPAVGTRYKSGPDLVKLFNNFGLQALYGPEFPSRQKFTEENLHTLNGTPQLRQLIEHFLDPRHFLSDGLQVEPVVEYFNSYLKFDNYQLVKQGQFYKVTSTGESLVSLDTRFTNSNEVSHQFIDEQIQKCERKINEGDYNGAITNARSLVEAVLVYIESQVDAAPPTHSGDLLKLYRNVQRHLNLDPSRKDISDSLKQLLTGLVSIVNGLASLRNSMSDAHTAKYKPGKHHAKLGVNAARTVADFMFETLEYQVQSGKIQVVIKE